MIMRMKGHNGFSPCPLCNITGLRVPDSSAITHYVPLDRLCHPSVWNDPSQIKVYDPQHLPMHTHKEFQMHAIKVKSARTNTAAENLSRQYGIKGLPNLMHIASLLFPRSFPHDFMHLIWENLIKNLILLWTGNFKGLDEGTGSYVIAKTVWAAIGAATAASGSNIPSAYSAKVPDFTQDGVTLSAEMWLFWTLYLGPVLLHRHFKSQKYYDHFVQLVSLLNTCLQFELSDNEIDQLEDSFID
ncbi:hypothetical protein PM082_014395 [Marasmius tenuissimus]|nr:hypothetical protein PM082_014395 [Marasmius tenuissimus]